MEFIRIRSGLYQSTDNQYIIERLDEMAERYPGDDWYNKWRVQENNEIWLSHFNTYKDAKGAIHDEDGQ